MTKEDRTVFRNALKQIREYPCRACIEANGACIHRDIYWKFCPIYEELTTIIERAVEDGSGESDV